MEISFYQVTKIEYFALLIALCENTEDEELAVVEFAVKKANDRLPFVLHYTKITISDDYSMIGKASIFIMLGNIT